MEKIININIQKLPEGFYLATSDSIQGLVAQGRTIAETIEIARDIAKKLIEASDDDDAEFMFEQIGEKFNFPLVLGV